MMSVPPPQVPTSIAVQALSWLGSALVAATVMSGLGVWVMTLHAPGESSGTETAPIVLTLAAPEAVAALPTPPPQVPVEAPARVPPETVAPAPPDPSADLSADLPPERTAAPRLPIPQSFADLPGVPDVSPLPPPQDLVQVPTKRPEARPRNPARTPDPGPAIVKPAAPRGSEVAAASVAGDAGQTREATRSAGVKAGSATVRDLKQRWGSAIRKKIEARKSYPAAARGVQGTVTVRLTIGRTGQLLAVSVARSAGHPALDQAAVRAVQSVARFPPAPDGMTDADYSFTLPIKYAN